MRTSKVQVEFKTVAVKTLSDLKEFEAAFARGEKVRFLSDNGNVEISPYYGSPKPPADLASIRRQLSYVRMLIKGLRACTTDADRWEWRDDLEVAELYAPTEQIRELCLAALSGQREAKKVVR